MKKIFLKVLSISLSCYIAFISITHISALSHTNNDENKASPFCIFDEKPESK